MYHAGGAEIPQTGVFSKSGKRTVRHKRDAAVRAVQSVAIDGLSS
jgi:hypothetical protein